MISKIISFCLSNRLLSASKQSTLHITNHCQCLRKAFTCPSANFTTGSILRSQLSELEYHAVADETMESLTEVFEDLPDSVPCDPEYDAQYSSGVLTVKISDKFGTYVINKQPGNLQIWLSSPVSGPFRYDFLEGTWIYKRTSHTLHDVLSDEVSKALNASVDFTKCAYGCRKES
ncbi:frataxin, mitochondrial-like isoform X2 [Ostrea edulis]|uniref:frataxin, mitochondrial-like isoform X2 n=1 Tax=Ostrea edulis TaxID=37623 RepID=UPI0024AEE3E3|nr:frataxin, mitochondrial-like isoform X2 [Ostrea edulis]